MLIEAGLIQILKYPWNYEIILRNRDWSHRKYCYNILVPKVKSIFLWDSACVSVWSAKPAEVVNEWGGKQPEEMWWWVGGEGACLMPGIHFPQPYRDAGAGLSGNLSAFPAVPEDILSFAPLHISLLNSHSLLSSIAWIVHTNSLFTYLWYAHYKYFTQRWASSFIK